MPNQSFPFRNIERFFDKSVRQEKAAGGFCCRRTIARRSTLDGEMLRIPRPDVAESEGAGTAFLAARAGAVLRYAVFFAEERPEESPNNSLTRMAFVQNGLGSWLIARLTWHLTSSSSPS